MDMERNYTGANLYKDEYDGDYYIQIANDRESRIAEEGYNMPCSKDRKPKVDEQCIEKKCSNLVICRGQRGFAEDVSPEMRASTYPPVARYEGETVGSGCCCD